MFATKPSSVARGLDISAGRSGVVSAAVEVPGTIATRIPAINPLTAVFAIQMPRIEDDISRIVRDRSGPLKVFLPGRPRAPKQRFGRGLSRRPGDCDDCTRSRLLQ